MSITLRRRMWRTGLPCCCRAWWDGTPDGKQPTRLHPHRQFEAFARSINKHSEEVTNITHTHTQASTNEGRILRPLLVTKQAKKICSLGSLDVNNLLSTGCVRYVDASESCTHHIAMEVSDVHAAHTFLEIHPVLFLGITAACIPFIQCNQSPRNA